MELEFTKMHGLGNDFVLFNGLEQDIELSPEQIRVIADRHFGIGCDQVLLLQPSQEADVRYRIFNADGAEVEQCGNGARCIADFLHKHGYTSGDVITAQTINGNIQIYIDGDDMIRVNMGVPRFQPEDIPLRAEMRRSNYAVELSCGTVSLMALSMGNPHAILVVDNVDEAPVASLGQEIQAHEIFPLGVNVGFMQILDPAHIRLRVYERGAGETLACGSGACAAVVAGHFNNKLETQVDVGLKGGHLNVSWPGEGESVWMTGPATTVYKGQIEL